VAKRNYKREYALESRERKDARAQRNRARRVMMNEGLARVGDGKDVGHKRAISKGGKNSLANLQMQDPSANRSFDRDSKRRMVSEVSTRERKKKK
jgi:hypothetical protein